jgi:predicted choloylglycine hydrolase
MASRNIEYKHLVIEGTAYEAGRQLGDMLKEDEEFINNMTKPFMGGDRLSKKQMERVVKLYDEYCHGTNEEIKGFADAIGAKYEDVVYYFAFIQQNGYNCSHIAVTPSIAEDGHCYLARNYEFSWNDKPILIESRIKDQYKQIGFSCQLFGRFDGMNEHGLCVTTSAGAINPNYDKEGFVFPVVVRAILNTCKTVKESVKLFESIEFADFRNFIIIDAMGNAALIEAATSTHNVSWAGVKHYDKYLFSTNHFNSDKLKQANYYVPQHSIIRYNAISKLVNITSDCIGKKALKKLLSTTMPEGICCHHYEDGMGTMWSIIFDPMEHVAEICFGAPDANKWRSIGLDNPVGMSKYTAVLPNEAASTDFWA